MRHPSPVVHLAGEDLRDQRHVSALVDGPDDAYALLMPFILEGFEQGDRAVHLVGPADRDAHLGRLASAGIDVAAATASHQLEVDTWDRTYLRDGHFVPPAQLAYLRDSLERGPRLGHLRTRLIGMMEWAVDGEAIDDLIRYEALVNDLLRRRSDVVVCTYDLGRHSASAIAGVLGVHPTAVVGGAIRRSQARDRATGRERILEAASQLFYESGTQATGVDTLIKAAGVAKATFYRHFPSKDDLIVAWLRDRPTRWMDRIREEVAAARPAPAAAVPMVFDALADWLETEGYRGCPYLNTSVEIADPNHPARLVIRDYLQEIEDYLAGLVAAAGYREPRLLGAKLQTLMAGSISLAVARRSNSSVAVARAAAVNLLESSERA